MKTPGGLKLVTPGMRFPESGDYVVAGALATVRIDRRRNRGRYVEPNVWMLHRVPMAGR